MGVRGPKPGLTALTGKARSALLLQGCTYISTTRQLSHTLATDKARRSECEYNSGSPLNVAKNYQMNDSTEG